MKQGDQGDKHKKPGMARRAGKQQQLSSEMVVLLIALAAGLVASGFAFSALGDIRMAFLFGAVVFVTVAGVCAADSGRTAPGGSR